MDSPSISNSTSASSTQIVNPLPSLPPPSADERVRTVFGADFDTISADAFYSTAPTIPFGGGSLSNVDIPKNSRTTIRFPFAVNYTTALDPNLAVLRDIATRCGFIGGTITQLRINYTIKLALKVVAIRITPQSVLSPSPTSSVPFLTR